MKATTLLNEILEKLSVLTKEDELAQELSQEEVQEEAVLSELDSVDETTKEVEEETTELSEEVATEEVEASSEEEVEDETELKDGYVSEEKYMADMGAMKAEIEAIKKMIDEEMGYMKKEKESLAEQVKELSKEPAAEPIKHSPEEEAKTSLNLYAQNRTMSTADKVFQRISNIKK
jgi:uncharacterized protein YhaN